MWLVNKNLGFAFSFFVCTLVNANTKELEILNFENATPTPTFEQILNNINLGNNAYYNKILSPAKSLNTNQSASARTQEANTKIASEIEAVVAVFQTSTEQDKFTKVQELIQKTYPLVLKGNGANIEFINGVPSAAVTRTFMMIEKTSELTNAKELLKSFTSYKRSAPMGIYVYEYADSKNITAGQIKSTVGNNNSWKVPLAAPAIELNQEVVLKKCIQVFGWRCVTSLYQVGSVGIDKNQVNYFLAFAYDLANNSDHANFNDARAVNQTAGSTAMYVVTESDKWILLYGVDSQWNTTGVSFAGLIQAENQKDIVRLKTRIAIDLKIQTIK